MTQQLKVEPCILLAASDSVAHIQTILQQAQKEFAVIADADQPQALVQVRALISITNPEHRQVADFVPQLPPPVVIEDSEELLESEKLRQILLLLKQTNAPGLIVYQNKQVTGVISLDTIVDALPLSAIPTTHSKELYGNFVTPVRAYTCHKCEKGDPPAPFVLPREGDAPLCPKHWLHGPMELVESETA
ncbi:MAG: hypothetical protein M3Z24_14485 [Chloroflexota bacterium]|nr:hypothetical protein [Chloroflexota bacterium]